MMLHCKPRVTLLSGLLLSTVSLSLVAPQAAIADQLVRPDHALGEVLITCQPGTTLADVNAIAASVGAVAVKPLLLTDTYKLTLPDVRKTEQDTQNGVAALKANAKVLWAGVNHYSYPSQTTGLTAQTPNDPLFNQQWGMQQINMPLAWALQKGQANVNVAVIDTSLEVNHPDLVSRVVPGASFDFFGNDTNPFSPTPGPDAQHGTHVSGIVAASTNNGIGVAGVCWQGVGLIGLKVFPDVPPILASDDTIANALVYATTNRANYHIAVINMSLGRAGDPTDTNNVEYRAAQAASASGIIIVVAAGNDAADTKGYLPSAFPFVTTVAAVKRNNQVTSYSNFGKEVDIAAPGGEPTTADPEDADGILSTRDGGYHHESGTSMASPHVAGIMALLVSSGATPDQARAALYNNANHSITGQGANVPSPAYGYGIADAYAALQTVTNVISVIDPSGIDPTTGQSSEAGGVAPTPVESLRPAVDFLVRGVDVSTLQVSLTTSQGTTTLISNGVPAPALISANNPILTDDQGKPLVLSPDAKTLIGATSNSGGVLANYTVHFRIKLDALDALARQQLKLDPNAPAQQYTLTINNVDPTAAVGTTATVQGQRSFTLGAHVFASGLSMISVPYYERPTDAPAPTKNPLATDFTRKPNEVFDSAVTLLRYLGSQGTYAKYPSTIPTDLPQNATLHPADTTSVALGADGSTTDVLPLGVGYFATLPNGAAFRTYGRSINTPVRITLQDGWNQIGNPYVYPISLATASILRPDNTQIDLTSASQSATGQTGTGQTSTGQLVLPYIWHLSGGSYTFETLPAGSINAWESVWLYVVPKSAGTNADGTSRQFSLTFAPVSGTASGTGRAARITKRATRSTLDKSPFVTGAGSWRLRLIAQTSTLNDSYNYVGVSARATDGNDITKAPKPPHLSPYVSLGITRSESPHTLFAQDLRSLSGPKTWDMAVETDQENADVTLTWPEMRNLPRSVKLTLTDVATGQTVDLRNVGSYQFNSGPKPTTRRFTLESRASTSTGRALFSNILINPTAGGRAAGTAGAYQIGYHISQDARVEISLMSANGRVLGAIMPTRAVSAGDNNAVWNGTVGGGQSLPAGLYVLQMRAVTNEGVVSREIRPLTLTGR